MAEIRNFRSGEREGGGDSSAPRRLAAIIVGDIASYSHLMQLDEEGTHKRVKRIQRDLVEPSISEHEGRLVKTTGDGFIAIFDSPVEAVRCAIVIQQNLLGRNVPLPKHSRIEYRIGVNLGDVIVEPDATASTSPRASKVLLNQGRYSSPAQSTSRSNTSWSAAMKRWETGASRTSPIL